MADKKSVIISLSDYNQMQERINDIENKGFHVSFSFSYSAFSFFHVAKIETKDELISETLERLKEFERVKENLDKIPMWVRRFFDAG